MGRLSNAIGVRLGNKIQWINNGIYIKKIKCIQYINFINNIVTLMSIGKVQKKDYFPLPSTFWELRRKSR